ncbi:MAG: hypothetical protein KF868_02615 [Acidobacteria bacterium]|nr:hypothetical protein [Acidobacteriota bacterium]MCW5966977.1 hypothetical protein [Blastocatellales bacterium]
MKRKDQPRMQYRVEGDCDHKAALIGYLYDEATASERTAFELHLHECSVCSEELSAFRRVREDLGSWQTVAAPRTEISIARSPVEVFRELIRMLPVWTRAAATTAIAAILLIIVLSVSRAHINLREGTITFGANAAGSQASVSMGAAPEAVSLTREDIERMIDARTTEVRASDLQQIEELRTRLAGLDARLAAADRGAMRLRAEVANMRAEQRALLARGQSTLGEWLFAVNGSREAWGGEDERDD